MPEERSTEERLYRVVLLDRSTSANTVVPISGGNFFLEYAIMGLAMGEKHLAKF